LAPVKVLLIKLNHLGDTLLLTPTIEWLAVRFPGAQIDVMVRAGCEAVLRGHPSIHRLIPVARPEKQRRRWTEGVGEFLRALRWVAGRRYDYAFALSESDRAFFWARLSRASVRGVNDAYGTLGWKRRLFTQVSDFAWGREHQVLKDFRTVTGAIEPGAQPGPMRFYPPVVTAEMERKFPFALPGRFAVVHTTSRWAFKQWMPERWAAVLRGVRERHGLLPVLTAGPACGERAYVDQVLAGAPAGTLNLAGQTSLAELGWLLGRARLFLGVDTVAMHLAAAMQTPTLALFGPSSEWSWYPWQCPHELVLGECSCKVTRQFVCDKSRPYPCMEKITETAVLTALARLLEKT
jgi:heptosyltransferase-3